MRSALLLLLIGSTLVGGCGSAKWGKKDGQKKESKKKKKDEADFPKDVAVGSGSTLVYDSEGANAKPSFSVAWTQGAIHAGAKTVETGRLTQPKGQLYQNEAPIAAYRADSGEAHIPENRLTLQGGFELTSTDRTQRLQAVAAEYLGGQKLVRARGDVRYAGPFGTLSGVPELWSSADFRFFGTPDMVSQRLKIPALLALAATVKPGNATIQQGTEYELTNVGPLVTRVLDAKAQRYETEVAPVSGQNLIISIPKQGLTMQVRGKVTFETSGKSSKIERVTTAAPITIIQTTPTGKTTITGVGANYRKVATSNLANLQVSGPVTLVQAGGNNGQLNGKGDRATATLLAEGANRGLQKAVLNGNVKIDFNGEAGKFQGAGDQLTYTPQVNRATAVLTGNLKLTGDVPGFLGNVEGADTLTVTLDEKSQWTQIEMGNSQGKPTTTNVKTDPKTGGRRR